MTAVVIPFPGRGRGDTASIEAVSQVRMARTYCGQPYTAPVREAPVLTEADVDQAQQSVSIIAPQRLRMEATACLEIAAACLGSHEGLVWEVRAFFCLSRMLDAALPPERRAQA